MEKSCGAEETSIGIRRLLDDLILDAAQSALYTSTPDEQEDVKVVKKSPEKIFQCEECEYSTLRRNAFYGHTRDSIQYTLESSQKNHKNLFKIVGLSIADDRC